MLCLRLCARGAHARAAFAVGWLHLVALLAILPAVPVMADPGQRIALAPYTETQTRPAWFRSTAGTCPGGEIHRRTLQEVIDTICPGGPNQWTYSHWTPQTNPQWGDLYCIHPVSGAVQFVATLNDSCPYEGPGCEVGFPGFVGKGGLAAAYCEKVTTRCPRGYTLNNGQCVVSTSAPPIDKAHMCVPPESGCVANPMELYYGNKYQIETDYVGAGSFPLHFQRFYNLPNTFVMPLQTDLALGAFGSSIWSHSYSKRIVYAAGGGLETVYAWRGNGKVFFFTLMDGVWTPDADISDRVERLTDGSGNTTGWRLIDANGDLTETYDSTGRLLAIANRAGLTHTLTYNPQGQLTSIADAFGRTLTLAYNIDGFVSTITDPAGNAYEYAYTPDYRLESVIYPGSGTRTYHYEVAGNPLLLTGITDENGARLSTYTYDGYLQSHSSERAGGAMRYTVDRNSYAGVTSVTVTDPLGTVRTYTAASIMGAIRTTSISGPPCPQCGPAAMSYDENGNVASRIDWNTNVTTYQYDLLRNLETSRTEASGTPEARTVTTEWHADFRLPTRIVEPGRETTMSYDAAGNMLTRSVRDTATNKTRTWTYTHNANGQVTSVDGPRTDVSDVTTYTYYANDDADLGKRGNLAGITNAAGHVTEILAYNAHGQPTEIRDPNGLVTILAYDARQRLISRSVGGETTSYAYDGVGQLTRVTLPDASHVDYSYDAAHRLTQIADSTGNKIVYTLDAMGNRVQEQVFDPSNNLVRTLARVYDNLNRLQQYIGAQ